MHKNILILFIFLKNGIAGRPTLHYSKLFLALLVFLVKINNTVLLISIPKSGTHLLFKTIKNITHQDIVFENSMKSCKNHNLFNISVEDLDLCTTVHASLPLHSHLTYKKEYEQLLLKKKAVVLFNIRDPRDQAVSLAHWQKDLPPHFPHAIGLPFNEVLTKVIINIERSYSNWLPWMNYPYALTVRFEDLVGTLGGGNNEKQLETIKAIARHVSVDLSDERADEIAKDLFGITKQTFRKGQIGSWKKEFTPEQKELFKIYGGELLVKLGYEKDLNW